MTIRITPTILKSSTLSLHSDNPCSESEKGRAYLDSSGRAKTRIKLLLDVNSDDGMEFTDEVMSDLRRITSLEMKVIKSSISVDIEGVRILSHEKSSSSSSSGPIVLTVEVVLRVNNDMVGRLLLKNKQKSGIIFVQLDVRGVFSLPSHDDSGENLTNYCHPAMLSLKETANSFVSIVSDSDRVHSLNSSNMKTSENKRSIYADPSHIYMELMDAFRVTCASMPAAHSAHGATLISVTISHSNTHAEPVEVSGISLHPGHSRPVIVREMNESSETKTADEMIEYTRSKMSCGIESDNRCMQGGNGVVDKSKNVRWCFVTGTVLDLPLVINPHESFSTIIQVDASENSIPKLFMSPVAVTGCIKSSDVKSSIVMSTYASWTTSRAAVSPANAFRVDMSLYESSFKVGEPFTLIVKVFNLSTEIRNVMILVHSKKNEDSDHSNVPAMAEVGGYSFGAWGLTDNGSDITQGKDDNILAIDAARLLGDILPQQIGEAELRFVPLREGVLDIPSFKIYDMVHGQFYDCLHTLQVLAEARL